MVFMPKSGKDFVECRSAGGRAEITGGASDRWKFLDGNAALPGDEPEKTRIGLVSGTREDIRAGEAASAFYLADDCVQARDRGAGESVTIELQVQRP